MPIFFAWQHNRNAKAEFTPVKISKESLASHKTSLTQIVELPPSETDLPLSVLAKIYPFKQS